MKTTQAGTGRGRKAMTLKELADAKQAKATGNDTQTQADAPAPAATPKRRMARKPREDAQQQAGAPAAAPAPKATRKKADPKETRSAGTGRGRGRTEQQQSGGDMGKQGTDTAGKDATDTNAEPMRGGTKNVVIQTMAMTGRGGRPAGAEEYPFSMLTPSVMEDGKIVGPSFFIPESDKAAGKLANARKRHGVLFWSRQTTEQVDGKGPAVPGLRIWRGTPALEQQARR